MVVTGLVSGGSVGIGSGDWSSPDKALIVRILVSVLLGGLIGLEREYRDKPAGLRTMLLICLGACLFTITSQITNGSTVDPTRIAAQVITGIGFIGAGAILHHRGSVVGLTTAATVWADAAIGMAVGFGYLFLAGFGTVVILLILFVVDIFEGWIGDRHDVQEYRIAMPNTAEALDRVTLIFRESSLRLIKRTWHNEGPSLVFELRVIGAKERHDQVRFLLARTEDFSLLPPIPPH